MHNSRVLLLGYGRMGSIHKKYLDELSVAFTVADPTIKVENDTFKQQINVDDFAEYTHIIISTPDDTHFEIYKNIRSISKEIKILIEKPAVLDIDQLDEILEDKNVTVGLVERFNKTVLTLKDLIQKKNINYIEFKRCSLVNNSNQTVSSFRDVGIHDLDLFDFLIGIEDDDEVTIRNVSNTYFGNISKKSGINASFLWSNEFYKKERNITVVQNNKTIYADLLLGLITIFSDEKEMPSKEITVENYSSIKNEIENFLSNKNYIIGYRAHKILIKNINKV